MNILITSASRKVSLVKAFQRALAKEGSKGKVITTDINPLSVAFHYSDLSYLVPKDSNSLFLPKLLALCQKHQIKLIVPTRDEELKIFAKNKEKFNEIGVMVMVSNINTIEICLDKLKFIEFCKKNNLLTPKIYTPEQIKKGVKFPLFINDRFSKGSKNAFKINNQNGLNLFLRHVKKPIIQEFINAKEYTIDLFADFQGRIISVVPRERIYVFGGESFIGKTYKNKKLIESAIDLAQKLRLIGHNTIQCFFDGKEVKFIEVNPRYGGGANLGLAAGANTPLYLVRLAKGKKVSSRIGKFKDGLIMLRYTDDIFLDEKKLKCKRI